MIMFIYFKLIRYVHGMNDRVTLENTLLRAKPSKAGEHKILLNFSSVNQYLHLIFGPKEETTNFRDFRFSEIHEKPLKSYRDSRNTIAVPKIQEKSQNCISYEYMNFCLTLTLLIYLF
jgi:hypothetical protein